MFEDSDFIKSCDVPGPTKEAIRAIILYKSNNIFFGLASITNNSKSIIIISAIFAIP